MTYTKTPRNVLPNGLTLLFVSSTFTTNAAVQKDLPFDGNALLCCGVLHLFGGSQRCNQYR